MNFKIFPLLLLLAFAGCDSLSRELARILPEKGAGGGSQLNPDEDSQFIDPTTIGNNSQESSPLEMPIGGDSGSMYGDPTQNPDYQAMMQQTDDIGIDPGQQMGAFVGEGEYAAAMTIDEPDTGSTNIDPATQYQMEVGEFEIPDSGQGVDVTSQYISQGGALDPAINTQEGQDPTAQYLAGANGNNRQPSQARPQSKPNPNGAPGKAVPAPQALRPKPQRPKRPSSGAAGTKVEENIQIGVPGNINPSYADFDAPAAVPQLLDRGTAMSFGMNLQQTRPLPGKGTVYWVIHSGKQGFSRFALPVRNGELPPRLQGVVPQFTPTSGPFRTFLVLVDSDNQVTYLTPAEQIPWNP